MSFLAKIENRKFLTITADGQDAVYLLRLIDVGILHTTWKDAAAFGIQLQQELGERE